MAFVKIHAKESLSAKTYSKRYISSCCGKGRTLCANNESVGIIEKMRDGSKNLDEVCSVKTALKAYQRDKG